MSERTIFVLLETKYHEHNNTETSEVRGIADSLDEAVALMVQTRLQYSGIQVDDWVIEQVAYGAPLFSDDEVSDAFYIPGAFTMHRADGTPIKCIENNMVKYF